MVDDDDDSFCLTSLLISVMMSDSSHCQNYLQTSLHIWCCRFDRFTTCVIKAVLWFHNSYPVIFHVIHQKYVVLIAANENFNSTVTIKKV